MHILIKRKDGTTLEFPHKPVGRPVSNALEGVGAFAVVTEPAESIARPARQTWVPVADILEIRTKVINEHEKVSTLDS